MKVSPVGMSVSQRIWWHTGPRTESGCREWTGPMAGKYPTLTVNGAAVGAHRLVLGLSPGDGRQALHSCDNPACVEPSHLRPGSIADNMRDKVERSRQARGADNGNSSLTAADVVSMRGMYANGLRQIDLARAFGVTQANVSEIVTGKTWRHIMTERAS